MKLLVALALVLTIASAFDLREAETNSSSIVVPAIKKEGRIHNGKTASEGQIPYQVSLVPTLENGTVMLCGGSLIGSQWVLTAAHCVNKALSVIVQLGALAHTRPEFSFTVSKEDCIVHHLWQRNRILNDIALIKIPAMSLTRTIQVVKLPARTGSHSSYEGKSVIVSGWGKTADNDKYMTEELRYARMQVIINSDCVSTYGNIITEKNICATSKAGSSICLGDSGGPLVLESDKVLIGVTLSGGKHGCGLPSVFIRVTSYLDWIHNNTGIGY